MAKRIINRRELRDQFDAAARRDQETETGGGETEEVEGEEEEDEEEEEGDAEAAEGEEAEGEGDEGEEGDEDGDEDAPKKKKKVKAKPVKAKAKPRTRTAKIVRKKLMWEVRNNSNQRVASYEYPKRKEADEHAARLTTDKKQTHYVQPVKENIEEKKE